MERNDIWDFSHVHDFHEKKTLIAIYIFFVHHNSVCLGVKVKVKVLYRLIYILEKYSYAYHGMITWLRISLFCHSFLWTHRQTQTLSTPNQFSLVYIYLYSIVSWTSQKFRIPQKSPVKDGMIAWWRLWNGQQKRFPIISIIITVIIKRYSLITHRLWNNSIVFESIRT